LYFGFVLGAVTQLKQSRHQHTFSHTNVFRKPGSVRL